MIPQRRNRVWGMAYIDTGRQTRSSVEEDYRASLKLMRTNYQFPTSLMFRKLPQEAPKERHAKLIEIAQERRPDSNNLFIDCASSEERLVYGQNVLPCLTPSHGIYSTQLKRYLDKQDVLNSQGLWPSCFNEKAYDLLLQMKSQDVAGNSFSSTVCQASVMTFLTCVPDTWSTFTTRPTPQPGDSGGTVLRRLKRKQPAPEYQPPQQIEKKDDENKKQRPRHKRAGEYKRKQAGLDSRKTAPGKRRCASIWEKEHLIFGLIYNTFFIFLLDVVQNL